MPLRPRAQQLRRGFRRIGMAFALLCILAGASVVSTAANQEYSRRVANEIKLEESQTNPKRNEYTTDSVLKFDDLIPEPSHFWEMAAIGAAVIAFGIFLFLGCSFLAG